MNGASTTDFKKAQYSIVLDLFNGSIPQDFKDSKLD